VDPERPRRRYHAHLDLDRGGLRDEQALQGRDRCLRRGEALLERAQVLGEDPAARREVRRGENLAHVLDGHLEVTEAADDLGDRDLGEGVVPIAGARSDGGGLEQADLVVVPQRLDAEVRDAREVSDGEHTRMVHPPVGGESSATSPLDPPSRRDRMVRA